MLYTIARIVSLVSNVLFAVAGLMTTYRRLRYSF